MNLLSGGNTPVDSMPPALQTAVQVFPSTHYVNFAQAILYRGAGFDIVWRSFAIVAAIGAVFLRRGAVPLPPHGRGQLLSLLPTVLENRVVSKRYHMGLGPRGMSGPKLAEYDKGYRRRFPR